jgi:16S rRNA (guanine527-N7)-methyltransferase
MARLERFSAMLAEENERQNLVSSASLAMIWQRHFADSLQLLDRVSRETAPWLDLGSGAGFPASCFRALDPKRRSCLSNRASAGWSG